MISDILDKLFALPGLILSIIELKRIFSSQPESRAETVEQSSQSAVPTTSTVYSPFDVTYEDKKFILTCVLSSFAFLAIAATIYQTCKLETVPVFYSDNFIGFLDEVLNRFIYGAFHLAVMLFYLLIGLSLFAGILHIHVYRLKKPLNLLIYLSGLVNSVYLSFLLKDINLADLSIIYIKASDSTSWSLLPQKLFPLITTLCMPIALFAMIILILHTLYVPVPYSPYLKERFNRAVSILMFPCLLTVLSFYWAYIL